MFFSCETPYKALEYIKNIFIYEIRNYRFTNFYNISKKENENMLFFILQASTFYNQKCNYLSSLEKTLKPISSSANVSMLKLGPANILHLKEGKPSKSEKVTFIALPKCEGYQIFFNGNKLCYNGKDLDPIPCSDKDEDFMLWDVVKRDEGYSICTAKKSNYLLLKYFYEYCWTYDLDNMVVKIKERKGNYEKQQFIISEDETGEQIKNETVEDEKKAKIDKKK